MEVATGLGIDNEVPATSTWFPPLFSTVLVYAMAVEIGGNGVRESF